MFLNFVVNAQIDRRQIVFYERYKGLCQSIGKSPSAVAEELGINKSNVSNWKNNGYVPRGEVIKVLADYFGVTTDYLLGNETEAVEISPQRKIMYSLTDDMSEDQIEQINDMIRVMFKIGD